MNIVEQRCALINSISRYLMTRPRPDGATLNLQSINAHYWPLLNDDGAMIDTYLNDVPGAREGKVRVINVVLLNGRGLAFRLGDGWIMFVCISNGASLPWPPQQAQYPIFKPQPMGSPIPPIPPSPPPLPSGPSEICRVAMSRRVRKNNEWLYWGADIVGMMAVLEKFIEPNTLETMAAAAGILGWQHANAIEDARKAIAAMMVDHSAEDKRRQEHQERGVAAFRRHLVRMSPNAMEMLVDCESLQQLQDRLGTMQYNTLVSLAAIETTETLKRLLASIADGSFGAELSLDELLMLARLHDNMAEYLHPVDEEVRETGPDVYYHNIARKVLAIKRRAEAAKETNKSS